MKISETLEQAIKSGAYAATKDTYSGPYMCQALVQMRDKTALIREDFACAQRHVEKLVASVCPDRISMVGALRAWFRDQPKPFKAPRQVMSTGENQGPARLEWMTEFYIWHIFDLKRQGK